MRLTLYFGCPISLHVRICQAAAPCVSQAKFYCSPAKVFMVCTCPGG